MLKVFDAFLAITKDLRCLTLTHLLYPPNSKTRSAGPVYTQSIALFYYQVDQASRLMSKYYNVISLYSLFVYGIQPMHEGIRHPPSDISGSFPNCKNCNELLLSDTVSCELLNNCSEHGSCTGPNECTCEKGYQGANCSEGIENCSMKNIRRDSRGSNGS